MYVNVKSLRVLKVILANTRVNAGDFSNIGYIYLMFV